MPITNSKEIRDLRTSLKLSPRQEKILVGSLLGDGCLIPNSWNKEYRYQVEQKKSQKEYVLWLYQEFRSWVLSGPSYQSCSKSWKFRTISHPELTHLASIFYSSRVKNLPDNIVELFKDPLSLAVWVMDDGCLMPRGDGFTLNTQSFTKSENEKLQECLAKNFSILYTSLHKDKNKVRLYIRKGSLASLYDAIHEYILPGFTYKLPIAL